MRCERASAYVRNQGIDDVSQLNGGIHRYLEAYAQDWGYWKGKNYTFDKRFSHGAEQCDVISHCVACNGLWDRYQAQAKCALCSIEVLLCKDCQRKKPAVPKHTLLCPLCTPDASKRLQWLNQPTPGPPGRGGSGKPMQSYSSKPQDERDDFG